jgi:hypothetical protein
MDRMDEIQELALRVEDVLYPRGIRRFDRVQYKTAYEEVWFLWEEEKFILIVEMRDTSLDTIRAAIDHTFKSAGDPALN